MRIVILLLLLLLGGGIFISEIYRRYACVKLGRPDNRSRHPGRRWKYLFTQIVLSKKIRKYPFFGWLHGFMMWGFLVLLFSSLEMLMEGLFKVRIPLFADNATYLFIRDCFIFLVSAGVIGSALRRIVKKPEWLHNSLISFLILALILLIVSSELLFYAVQTSQGESGVYVRPGLSPSLSEGAWLVLAASPLFTNLNNNSGYALMELFWWVHFLAIFTFLVIIPRSKHLHLIFAPFNTYWHSLETGGALPPVRLTGEKKEIYGVGKPEDFTWKQLLDAFSCVKCGRCHGSCPVFQSDGLLKLKKLNGRIRSYMEEKSMFPLIPEKENLPIKRLVAGVLEEKSLWSCTTCGACEEACPVSCEHISKIIELRRYIVSGTENIAPEMKQVFIGIENLGNPWGINFSRNAYYGWAEELGIPACAEKPDAEYLYFIGCYPAYEESARKAAIALAKILISAGIDFTILREEEWCCGETVRRLGNEYLFQKTAQRNIKSWTRYGFQKIITTCPHCFNTLQNEYPQFGGNYQVIPHTVFLNELMQKGKLKPGKYDHRSVTYHDSCYLGRFNGFYNEPRKILKAIPGVSLLEMPRARENSFCCGAGGGQFWLKGKSENPISRNRVQEALVTGAGILATACPYCQSVMQEEIRREGLEKMGIIDIAEILADSL